MSAADNSLRRIVIDNDSYLWRVRHQVGEEGSSEALTVFLEGVQQSAFKLRFIEDERIKPGLEMAGVVLVEGEETFVNLNRPATVEKAVRRALLLGWRPGQTVGLFEVQGDLEWLRVLAPGDGKV
jgi:hypothetical protein